MYIYSKFLCRACQGYHENGSPYAISENPRCFSRSPTTPPCRFFLARTGTPATQPVEGKPYKGAAVQLCHRL